MKIIIGRHVSLSSPDYLLGALNESISYGANSFMIYTGSPQNTFRKSVSDLKIGEFKKKLKENFLEIDNIVVHASYLINLANTLDKAKSAWSTMFLKQEISIMDQIGLKTLVLHPGSSLGADKNVALESIASLLNKVLSTDSNVRIALETMSGRKNELGVNFDEIKFIIDRVDLKEKIGVCWDTCHLYSSGYDIKDKLDEVIKEFDEKIGIEKLWVIHLNDTVNPINSRKDRHANIGKGCLGFQKLKDIVYHKDFTSVVKILETPTKDEFYKDEIKLIKYSS